MIKLTNDPKQILVLNYEYPPVGGGAGQVSHNLCQFFANKGLKIIVITGWIPGLRWIEHDINLTIIRVPMLKLRRDRTTVLGMASYLFFAFFPMCFLILQKKVDLIHSHFAMPVGFLSLLSKKVFRIPYVITLHGGDVPGMVSEQTDYLFKWFKNAALCVVKNAGSVTTVSSGLRDLAKESYPVSIEVIPNGIQPSWIINKPLSKKKDLDEIRLVFAGRLTHQKNVSALIKAMELLSKHSKYRLDILGDGPLLESLKTEALKSNNIHFHGWLSVEQVKDFLASADIFILPSFSEGLSIAALQAMGQGCALVASDIPMNKDILDESVNGFFCKHSPESISKTIMKCIPYLDRLKAGSVAKVLFFSWEAIGERYLDCFRNIFQNVKSV